MDFLDDPAELTPEQRLAELVAILELGVGRLPNENKRLDVPGADRPPLGTGGES